MTSKRIACIVGARPNFMKIASLMHEMQRRPVFQPTLIHTGQHSSPEMSDSFFQDLKIPRPDVSLGVGGGTSTSQTARIMQALEPVLCADPADLVLVVGDVNSTIAAALVAAKAGIRVAHVEAGLRSFDRSMPEEINRVLTDALSDFLFTTEQSANENLAREGVSPDRVFFCGNLMIDTLLRFRVQAGESRILERLQLSAGAYAVVTLHRPSNVDDPQRLRTLLEMLERVGAFLPVIFPMHPRTSKQMQEGGASADRKKGAVTLCDPLGYIDFLRLMSEAKMVLTDSGGIQEETTVLQVPCITIRENTERPVTISHGTNRLAGVDPSEVYAVVRDTLNSPPLGKPAPPLWDGQASGRILNVLEQVL
jgi:UDP-N-acetylglucosamine 2-epimerase (non-hydrolysing)